MARTPEMMGAARAARFLGVHRETLRGWYRIGQGPPRELMGKRYWYCREALKEWLKNGARAVPPAKPVEPMSKPGGLSPRAAAYDTLRRL